MEQKYHNLAEQGNLPAMVRKHRRKVVMVPMANPSIVRRARRPSRAKYRAAPAWLKAKWERCVKKVKARGGKYNAFAVCTASISRKHGKYHYARPRGRGGRVINMAAYRRRKAKRPSGGAIRRVAANPAHRWKAPMSTVNWAAEEITRGAKGRRGQFEASARKFYRKHPEAALRIRDEIGSRPVGDPALRALQKVVDPYVRSNPTKRRRKDRRAPKALRRYIATRAPRVSSKTVKDRAHQLAAQMPVARHFMEGGDGVSGYLWFQRGTKKFVIMSVNGRLSDKSLNRIGKQLESDFPGSYVWFNLD